jgi:hypothetical protein
VSQRHSPCLPDYFVVRGSEVVATQTGILSSVIGRLGFSALIFV